MEAIHVEHKDFILFWKQGEMLSQGATFFYTDAWRRYTKLYLGRKIRFDDSFVVVSSSREVLALVPLYAVIQDNGSISYSHGSEHIRAPLFFCSFSSNLFSKVASFVFSHIKECARKNSVGSHLAAMEAVELLEGRFYFNLLMEYGYKQEYGITNIIDLKRTTQELWTLLYKSYHRLINRAGKNFQVKIVDSQNFDFHLCEQYRQLHHLAAGRVTRPIESFHVMYDLIKENKGFLVLVFDENAHAKGAHLFFYNGIYAYSGSAANDPSLPSNSGVGHLGVWEGILCAQRYGCRYLDQGPLMHQQGAAPSAKEINIDSFKRGFGGTRVTIFRGTLEF